jgi:hypothetical protein
MMFVGVFRVNNYSSMVLLWIIVAVVICAVAYFALGLGPTPSPNPDPKPIDDPIHPPYFKLDPESQ